MDLAQGKNIEKIGDEKGGCEEKEDRTEWNFWDNQIFHMDSQRKRDVLLDMVLNEENGFAGKFFSL